MGRGSCGFSVKHGKQRFEPSVLNGIHMRDFDPEFQLCEAKALFDSLASHLARKPPDEALTRMAGVLTKLIDDLGTLGKEPLPKEIKERQVKLFGECTSISAEIKVRVLAIERELAEAAGETKRSTN